MDDEELDELYALPPEEFVVARDRLAKSLKSRGLLASAREVSKLRRPTVTAAAVNALVRSRPEEVAELLDLGAELREAQRSAVTGGGGAALRELTTRRRALVARLAGGDQGVAATLEAATTDEDVAEDVRRGRVSREVAPAGFGFESLGDVEVAPRRDYELEKAQERARQLREEAVRLREEADRLAEEAAEAKRRAKESEREARRAELAADTAEQAAYALGERSR